MLRLLFNKKHFKTHDILFDSSKAQMNYGYRLSTKRALLNVNHTSTHYLFLVRQSPFPSIWTDYSQALQALTLVTLEKHAVVITLTVLASFLEEEKWVFKIFPSTISHSIDNEWHKISNIINVSDLLECIGVIFIVMGC